MTLQGWQQLMQVSFRPVTGTTQLQSGEIPRTGFSGEWKAWRFQIQIISLMLERPVVEFLSSVHNCLPIQIFLPVLFLQSTEMHYQVCLILSSGKETTRSVNILSRPDCSEQMSLLKVRSKKVMMVHTW